MMTALADNSVVCLLAPTASGKTALAYELYDTGRYELISVDSALIYKHMNIGTAKPSQNELKKYPHHLVNIIEPTQSYSVAQFVSDVERLIPQIHAKGKIPLLVGGTMMYYMALFEGLSNVPDSDAKIRTEVAKWQQQAGIDALYDYLAKVDPKIHARLKPNDTQRITRAVEVYKQTGRALSDWQNQPKNALAWQDDMQWHGLTVMPDRQWLHKRIEQRLDIMWQQGLVDEVIDLLQNYPLTPNDPAMRCVGYRQVLEYLVAVQHPILDSLHLDTASFYHAFAMDKFLPELFFGNINVLNPQTHLSASCAPLSLLAPLSALLPNGYANLNPATVLPPKPNSNQQKLACQRMRNKALYATRQLAKRQYTWLKRLIKNGNITNNLPTYAENKAPPCYQSFSTMDELRKYLL